MTHQIKIYSTPHCGYCQMAKEYFKKHGLAFEEYDVFKDVMKRQEMVQTTGQLGVPVIRIDDQIIIGFNRTKINELLGIN